jgi:hypothetical protein
MNVMLISLEKGLLGTDAFPNDNLTPLMILENRGKTKGDGYP